MSEPSTPLAAVLPLDVARVLYLGALSLLVFGMGVAFLTMERTIVLTVGTNEAEGAFSVVGSIVKAGMFMFGAVGATAWFGRMPLTEAAIGPAMFAVWAYLLVKRVRSELPRRNAAQGL